MVWASNSLASGCLLLSVYGAIKTPTFHEQASLPADADVGANLIPNIDDPTAINAQSACPGYKASNVRHFDRGLTANLRMAGEACNAYGTDVDSLDLTVEYLAKNRLNVQITPSHVDVSNASWYLLDENIVPRPLSDKRGLASNSDFEITWSNDPSFSFKVSRKANGDVLFDTTGSVLVFENQFVEFVTALPNNYNLYGIGEHIQQLRLLRNATMTIYAADYEDPIDG